MSTVFLRDIPEGNLSLEDADIKQNHLINELRNIEQSKITVEQISFFKKFIIYKYKRKDS